MFEWLISPLEALINSIGSILKTIGYMIGSLGDMLKILGTIPSFVENTLLWLPATVVGMVMTLFVIVIFFKILGRE